MMWLLDPGHGVNTPGKRSPDGLFEEWAFNRYIARLVMGELPALGYFFACIVPEDEDVPLVERVRRVNNYCKMYGKENVALISIHANAAGDGSKWMSAQGWSAYTSKGHTGSDELAECMYDGIESVIPERRIRVDMSDGDRDWEENFYVLKKTPCRAVLLENYFYDNEDECRFLLTEDARERIARGIVAGIIRFEERK